MDQSTGQYLTFTLAGEIFALDIASVREVLEWTPITKVPRTRDHIRGVINLRGRAVPVVDMRRKFGLAEITRTMDTCMIIVEVRLDGEETVLGALADSVKEVIDIESANIEPAPRMGTTIRAEFIKGLARHDDDFIMLLDVDTTFAEEEPEDGSAVTEHSSAPGHDAGRTGEDAGIAPCPRCRTAAP